MINDTELLSDDSLDNCIWLNEEQVDMMLAQMKSEKQQQEMEEMYEEMDEEHHRRKRKVIDFNRFSYNMWPTDRPVAWKFDGAHSKKLCIYDDS